MKIHTTITLDWSIPGEQLIPVYGTDQPSAVLDELRTLDWTDITERTALEVVEIEHALG